MRETGKEGELEERLGEGESKFREEWGRRSQGKGRGREKRFVDVCHIHLLGVISVQEAQPPAARGRE